MKQEHDRTENAATFSLHAANIFLGMIFAADYCPHASGEERGGPG